MGNFGHHFWGCRSHFGTSRSPFGDVFCALNSEMRNPRNGPKKGANFFGPFRGHVGMPCHETYQIGGTFQEANRPAALETYHFVRFMVRFVAGHPHMPSKRSKKNWPSFLDRFVDFAFENPGAKNTQNAMAKFPSGSPGASASSIRTARQRRQKAIRQAPRLTSTAPSHSAPSLESAPAALRCSKSFKTKNTQK